MDFYVCLERPGFSVARRRAQKNKVGVQHKVTKDDAIKWWVQCTAMQVMTAYRYMNAYRYDNHSFKSTHTGMSTWH